MLKTSNLDPTLVPGAKPAAAPVSGSVSGKGKLRFPPPGLIPGSTTAQALYQVASGREVTVVCSPPGAGKSTLVAHVIAHLWNVTDMQIGVATVSHPACNELLGRIAQLTGPDTVRKSTSQSRRSQQTLPEYVEELDRRKRDKDQRRIIGRVAKSWQYVNAGPGPAKAGGAETGLDLMVIDEAWQLTYAELTATAKDAPQVLLIGDPGQTSPIVLGSAVHWQGWDSPAKPGPEVMAQMDEAVTLTMPSTFRLGQDTVDVIAPLYSFPFRSERPGRTVLGPGGKPSPEISARLLSPDADAVETSDVLARLAESYHGRELAGDGVGGDLAADGRRTVGWEDIAIVAARNGTVAAVTAALAARGVPVNCDGGVTVNTANSLQGGQWHVVIALDPAHGQSRVSSHTAELGRLCVMLSRHMTCCEWVHDGEWGSLFRKSGLPLPDIEKHLTVRQKITARQAPAVRPARVVKRLTARAS